MPWKERIMLLEVKFAQNARIRKLDNINKEFLMAMYIKNEQSLRRIREEGFLSTHEYLEIRIISEFRGNMFTLSAAYDIGVNP